MKPDIVVYTAILGDYDVLLPPDTEEENVDYICFTDESVTVPEPWEEREIEASSQPLKMGSGRLKMLPHEYFPEYEYSIWIDGNIQIQKSVNGIIDRYLGDTHLAVASHPKRSCIYEEADTCVEMGKTDEETVEKQMRRYREEGFPKDYGLSATGVLIRRHNKADVVNAMNIWWDEFRNFSNRDQLSFEYATWKRGLNYNQMSIRFDSESTPFRRHYHKPPGYIGDIWEYLVRNDDSNNNTGFFRALATFFYYLYRAPNIARSEHKSLYNEIIRKVKKHL